MQRQTGHDFSWVLAVPSFCRNQAVEEALMAYRTNSDKQAKQKKAYRFDVKYRSRLKDSTECITFSSEDWGRRGGAFSDLLSRDRMRGCQSPTKCRDPGNDQRGPAHVHRSGIKQPQGRTRYNLPAKIYYDFKIVRIRSSNKYYLCIPSPLDVLSRTPRRPSDEPYRVAALDPGVRTFQTGFDTDGTAFELGSVKDERRILRLCQHLDALESRRHAKSLSDSNRFALRYKKRRNMGRAAARMRERIRDLVEELHKKASLWLCRNYDAILIPEFQTSRMAKRSEERQISNKTCRMMYTWAHFRFRQRLIHKAREYPRCNVVVVREDYTSKTCGRCGHLNKKLRGEKTYSCRNENCSYVADRDISAARNILLRYLTEHTQHQTVPAFDIVKSFG